MRLKLTLRYDGSPYHGWQVQKNAPTVQGTLGEAFARFLGFPVNLTGCSRTDTGVHAREFVCHTDLNLTFDPARLPAALNSFLPDSIALLKAQQAPEDFHARYSVRTKTYRYFIHNAPTRDPFLTGRALFWPKKLDYERFCEAAAHFAGEKDFSAFMASGSKITDPVRTVTDCHAFREGALVGLEITADGFLYNMVRIIVGTLLTHSGGENAMDLDEIIASRDRKKAGFTAPPHGLYLWRVDY